MADLPIYTEIDFGDALRKVTAYYSNISALDGTGDAFYDIIEKVSVDGVPLEGAGDYYWSQAGVDVLRSQNGKILGYYKKTAMLSTDTSPVSTPNSNAQGSAIGGSALNTAKTAKINGTATMTTEGGVTTTTFKSGAKSVSTGARVATVGANVLFGVGMVSLAGHLGKLVNDAFYDSGASWAFSEEDWDDFYWDQDGLGKFLLNALYGVDGDSATMYMDEEMLAQSYMMLRDMGVFDDIIKPRPSRPPTYQHIDLGCTADALATVADSLLPNPGNITWLQAYQVFKANMGSAIDSYTAIRMSPEPSNHYYEFFTANTNGTYAQGIYEYTEYYRLSMNSGSGGTFAVTADGGWRGRVGGGNYMYVGKKQPYLDEYSIAAIDNSATLSPVHVDGIEDDPQATTYIDPDLINGQDRATVLQQLKDNYPELFSDSIYQDVPQDDGTNKRITYVPVPYVQESTQPTTGSNHQNNPQINTLTNTISELIDVIKQIVDNLNADDVPEEGEGNTPVVPVPTGSASSLWKIYNPTQAQIDAFGAWLWDSSFVEQIKKLFNDPMQGIIGVHKVFATPSTGGTANIKVGYLDSEISSLWVDNQYTSVDCGSCSLREYFGNVFDYSPYTKVNLYLPFIGIVELDVGDVMRSTISVKYHIDVLTGACLVDVIVNRDGAGGVLYQYAGSAIVQYPVSSGTYLGAIAGVAAVATGAIATVATAGSLAPMAMGVAGTAAGLSHIHANVGKSGSFTGCAGAMGSKKPYLIVSRPQTAMANNYKHFTGLPANSHVRLGDCDGYTVVKAVYVSGIHRATEEEKDMIYDELRNGVLV